MKSTSAAAKLIVTKLLRKFSNLFPSALCCLSYTAFACTMLLYGSSGWSKHCNTNIPVNEVSFKFAHNFLLSFLNQFDFRHLQLVELSFATGPREMFFVLFYK